MLEPTLATIWTKLVKIEKMLEMARLQRIVDRDYNSVGHVMLGTIEEIRNSGFAAEFGYSDAPTDI